MGFTLASLAGIGLTILLYLIREAKIAPPKVLHAGGFGLAAVLLAVPLTSLVPTLAPVSGGYDPLSGLLSAVLIGMVLGGLVAGLAFRLLPDPASPSPPAPAVHLPTTPPAQRASEDLPLDRVRKLTHALQEKIQVADKIEYDMRDKPARTQPELLPFEKRIEDWRTDVGQMLRSELPASGADTRFLTFTPELGKGPAWYEYQRLIAMRTNLV